MALKNPHDVRIEARASAWCICRPVATILIAASILSVSIWGALRLRVDPSPERYMAGTDVWSTYQRVDGEYDISETAVIAFRELGGTVFDVETVSSVAALDRMLAEMPEVARVLSIASATALDRENDVLDLLPLLPSGAITRDTAMKLAARIRRHPVYSKALIDEQHETTFIFIQLARDVTDPIRRIEAVRAIREKADSFREKHRTVHFAGSLFTKEAVATEAQRDTLIYFPLLTLLLALSLWLVFGEAIACIVPLSAIGFSSMVALGFLGFLRVPLTLCTAQMPAILLVAGLASSVAFLAELRRQYARTNDPDASLVGTIESLAASSLITTLAAVAAFLALGRSKVTSIRELGYATALGCLAVHASIFFVTPAVLRLLDYPRGPARPFGSAQWIGQTTTKLARAVQRHMIATLAIVGLLSGVFIAALSSIRIDSSYIGNLASDHRLRQDMAVIERTLGGSDTIELILDGEQPGYFKGIEELALLDRLGKALEVLPGIHTAFSLADYLEIANGVMLGNSEGALELPKSTEAVAQLMAIDPTPFSAFATSEMQEARIALQIQGLSSAGVLQLATAAKERADRLLAGRHIASFVTGLPIIWAKLSPYLIDDASSSFLISALLVWAVMIIGFKSPIIGSASMLPNLLAVLFALGTMSIIGLDLDANVIFLFALATALSAHHSIQLAARYQRGRDEGSPSPQAAATYALTNGGHPIAVTSLLILVGFGVLCISSFRPTRLTGILGAILAGWTLILDLVLLPALLMTAESILNRYAPPKLPAPAHANGKSHIPRRDSLIPAIEKEEDPVRTTDSPIQ